MGQRKVRSLTYRFTSVDTRRHYDNAEPLQTTIGPFDVRLTSSVLEATPTEHFGSEEEARAHLDPLLQAWELKAELEDGVPIRFMFSGSQVESEAGGVDAAVQVLSIHAASHIHMASNVEIRVDAHAFPLPAKDPLASSPLVEELLSYVRDVRGASQRLLVTSYLFLTRLEFEYGRRDDVADAINVQEKVLRTLGKLSVVNDPQERRKVKGPERKLTEAERQWLTAVVPRITLQVAAIEADAAPAKLEMSSLPTV